MVEQPSFLLTAFGSCALPAGTFFGLDHQHSVLLSNGWAFIEITSLLRGRRLAYVTLEVNILSYNGVQLEVYEQYFLKCFCWDPIPTRCYVTKGSGVK